jgi:apolipoprotein N-acyltransferase
MNRWQKLLLSFSSGVLLWLAWPPLPFFPLLFVGFVPILWLEEVCRESKKSPRSFFGYAYLALLVWNLLTTWWVGATYLGTHDISTAIAGLIANTANPLLMSIPLIGFHRTRKRFGDTIGYISLPAYWITFEFIHLRWDLTWPWLTLGNGFSKFPAFIQWYDVTGALGGTLWVLAVNILLFRLLYVFTSGKIYLPYKKLIIATASALFLPIIISLLQYSFYSEKGKEEEVVIVQPNIDPYNAKFDPSTLDQQMETLIRLSKKSVDSATDYLVFPETALPDGIMIDELHTDHYVRMLHHFQSLFPGLKIVTGISAYAKYQTAETSTARKSDDGSFYFDAFNSAIQIDSTNNIPIYHKSKLVPGVERMPYPELFKFLEPLAINMGGITGSLGTQPHRSVFFSSDSTGAAPLICYESIYGEYTNEYVQRGANFFSLSPMMAGGETPQAINSMLSTPVYERSKRDAMSLSQRTRELLVS